MILRLGGTQDGSQIMAETDKAQSWEASSGQPMPHAPGDEGSTASIETSHEARNMAMLCHILGVVGFLAPLVIWLSEKDKHKFVYDHGQAAMNYQVSLMIYFAISWLLCVILIGFVLIWVLTIVHVVLIVMGALKASRGEHWQYPIAIHFLK